MIIEGYIFVIGVKERERETMDFSGTGLWGNAVVSQELFL